MNLSELPALRSRRPKAKSPKHRQRCRAERDTTPYCAAVNSHCTPDAISVQARFVACTPSVRSQRAPLSLRSLRLMHPSTINSQLSHSPLRIPPSAFRTWNALPILHSALGSTPKAVQYISPGLKRVWFSGRVSTLGKRALNIIFQRRRSNQIRPIYPRR